jgi:hypothetical protein
MLVVCFNNATVAFQKNPTPPIFGYRWCVSLVAIPLLVLGVPRITTHPQNTGGAAWTPVTLIFVALGHATFAT